MMDDEGGKAVDVPSGTAATAPFARVAALPPTTAPACRSAADGKAAHALMASPKTISAASRRGPLSTRLIGRFGRIRCSSRGNRLIDSSGLRCHKTAGGLVPKNSGELEGV